jgi:hypothetical protein
MRRFILLAGLLSLTLLAACPDPYFEKRRPRPRAMGYDYAVPGPQGVIYYYDSHSRSGLFTHEGSSGSGYYTPEGTYETGRRYRFKPKVHAEGEARKGKVKWTFDYE